MHPHSRGHRPTSGASRRARRESYPDCSPQSSTPVYPFPVACAQPLPLWDAWPRWTKLVRYTVDDAPGSKDEGGENV